MFDLIDECSIDERKITVHKLLTKYSLNRTSYPTTHFNSDIIESLFFRLPTNKIWLYTISNEQCHILSGNYIFDIDAFVNDLYPLENLKLFPEYDGFKFSDMKQSLQRRIEENYLDVVLVHIYKHRNVSIITEKIKNICLTF